MAIQYIQYAAPMVNTLSEVPNSYGFMGKRAHINYPLYRETAEHEKVIGRCYFK